MKQISMLLRSTIDKLKPFKANVYTTSQEVVSKGNTKDVTINSKPLGRAKFSLSRKFWLLTGLIALFTVMIIPVNNAKASTNWIKKACPSPQYPSAAYVRDTLIPCAVKIWPPKIAHPSRINSYCYSKFNPYSSPLKSARYIACKESNFHWNSYNPSGCYGVYQFKMSTYLDARNARPLLKAATSPNPYDARSNVLVAVRIAHDSGWSPWSA